MLQGGLRYLCQAHLVFGSLILEIISNLLSFRDSSFDLYKSTNLPIINLHCITRMPRNFQFPYLKHVVTKIQFHIDFLSMQKCSAFAIVKTTAENYIKIKIE